MAALLVDEGIGRDLVQTLVAQGLPAYHWLQFGPKGANDSLVFLEAQQRSLTIFTYNRDDYVLLATAWHNWGHGHHHGTMASSLDRSGHLNSHQRRRSRSWSSTAGTPLRS